MSPRLRIIICGAGIAGFCTGIGLAKLDHEVLILERANELSPIGAGIHVPPNATLVLKHWNILDKFDTIASVPAGFTFRRYADSSVLARSPKTVATNAEETPYWTMQRADYQRILHDVALEAGCQLLLGHKVVGVDEQQPSVRLADGEDMKADLVILADGMKSNLRQIIIPEEDVSPLIQPLTTYRAWAPREAVLANSAAASFFESPSANIWMGPGRHAIVYAADNGRIFSVNGTHPDRNNAAGEWHRSVPMDEIQHQFREFDPAVQRILQEAKDCKAWTLAEVPRLPRWTSQSGKVVALGDAAHGMLQFLAQGAAMATEDAAALAECVRRVKSQAAIPSAMRVFERSRKWRCEKVQAQARRNGETIHMPDGEEQEHRDRKMAGNTLPDDQEVDCGPLLDTSFTTWLYNHNVIDHTNSLLDAAGL